MVIGLLVVSMTVFVGLLVMAARDRGFPLMPLLLCAFLFGLSFSQLVQSARQAASGEISQNETAVGQPAVAPTAAAVPVARDK